MNYRFVLQQLGLLALVLAGAMAANVAGMVLLAGEGLRSPAVVALSTSAGIVGALGFSVQALSRTRGSETLGRREALLLVGSTWLLGAVGAALPFYLWALFSHGMDEAHAFVSPAACYFEAMSGLTTTGATVVANVDHLPQPLLLWRSLTQWMGGLGIVVLFVAVLPSLGVGGKRLFAAETTGPTKQGVRPQVRDTARVLWLIYAGLTGALVVIFWLLGMGWYDALDNALSTTASGGFSTRNASIGYFESWKIDLVTVVFMFMAGVNFGLYYRLSRGDVASVVKDRELWWYLGIVGVATVLVTVVLLGHTLVTTAGYEVPRPEAQAAGQQGVGLAAAFRYASFAVVSVQTTTGFATADWEPWPFAAKAVLIAVMFVGGMAGSTAGGIKVVRIVVMVKVLMTEVGRVFRPAKVRPVRVGESAVSAEMRQATLAYVLIVGLLWAVGTVGLMVLEPAGSLDFGTAASASVATVNNIGPGMGAVGPMGNYGLFSSPSLLLMSLLMALGRLELFAVLVLIAPSFWRRA
ncbi:MAG: TrkH family potassium uptake protein [Planctomycetota bacterium]